MDVTQVDGDSLKLHLEGNDHTYVTPVRSDFEDVATPFYPLEDKPLDPYACTTEGPDGYLDLTLKFEQEEVTAMLGDVNHDEVLKLVVEGELFDGTPIIGEDIIQIIKK